jgi:hypothetical protein
VNEEQSRGAAFEMLKEMACTDEERRKTRAARTPSPVRLLAKILPRDSRRKT